MSLRPSFLLSALAALASVLLVVATPAMASPIVIDDFSTGADSDTAFGTGSAVTANISRPTLGAFDGNALTAGAFQTTPRGFRTATTTVSGGFGTLAITNDGTGNGSFLAFQSQGNFDYNATSPANLTAGGNNLLRIVTGSAVPASPFAGYVTVNGFTLPQTWTTNTTFEIPFASFTGVDFSSVTNLIVGFQNPSVLAGNTSFSETLTLDSISAVPEPGAIAMMATGGAALVAGFIGRRRIAAKA
jgi:hypothetical protein